MTPPSSVETPAATCQLAATLDVASAAELRALLLDLLDAGRPSVLDGSAVTKVDTACLQILCAFARDASETGRPLSWAGASPALKEAAHRLGLSGPLALG